MSVDTLKKTINMRIEIVPTLGFGEKLVWGVHVYVEDKFVMAYNNGPIEYAMAVAERHARGGILQIERLSDLLIRLRAIEEELRNSTGAPRLLPESAAVVG